MCRQSRKPQFYVGNLKYSCWCWNYTWSLCHERGQVVYRWPIWDLLILKLVSGLSVRFTTYGQNPRCSLNIYIYMCVCVCVCVCVNLVIRSNPDAVLVRRMLEIRQNSYSGRLYARLTSNTQWLVWTLEKSVPGVESPVEADTSTCIVWRHFQFVLKQSKKNKHLTKSFLVARQAKRQKGTAY
jgi:hypothetical protein